jgi:hypothetical protein
VIGELALIDSPGWVKATDTEVTMYLSAASGLAPFNSDWTDIFVHQVSRDLVSTTPWVTKAAES